MTTPPAAVPLAPVPGEMPALTSLRMLAALLVFLFHFPPQGGGLASLASREGHVGVTVFFVLSGFLITVRYLRPLERGEVSLREYFGKRAARILPLYWTVLGVSLVFGGRDPFGPDALAEWTLTHGFLARSVDHLAVPTSWTLTLEECFYALAPLIFLAVRRSRRPWWPLLGFTLILLGAGVVVLSVFEGSRFGFLASARELVTHTIFGRFVDFALGIGAALLFLSSRTRQLFSGPGGPTRASLGALLAMGLVLAAEFCMAKAGGVEGETWARAWVWNEVIAVASAGLILCLTCRESIVARVLGLPLFVYLGKISYALYLVQMTPLGKGLLYRIIPGDSAWFVPALYVGMSVLSALLYELVEEPGRRLVTRLVSRGARSPARLSVPLVSGVAAGLLAAAGLAVQATSWSRARVAERLGPPSLADVERALGSRSDRILTVRLAGSEGPLAQRVRLPEPWFLGPATDRRAPTALLLFADGQAIDFRGGPRGADLEEGDIAFGYFKRPRAEFLELHLPEGHAGDLSVVRHDLPAAAAIHLERLRRSPSTLVLWAGLVAAALVTGWRLAVSERRRGRTLVAGCIVLLTIWAWSAGVFGLPGAWMAIVAQVALALALSLPRRLPTEPSGGEAGPEREGQ